MTGWAVDHFTVASPDHPTECQDTVATLTDSHDRVLLCVADGAGSSKRAGEASRAIVEIAIDSFNEDSDTPLDEPDDALAWMQAFVERCGLSFEAWLGDQSGRADDYNTTLAVVIVGDVWTMVAGIGDGFVLVLDVDHRDHIALGPDKPSTTSTSATYMMADWRLHANYRVMRSDAINGVLVSTDGLEKLLRYKTVRSTDGTKHQRLWGVNKFVSTLLHDFVATKDPQVLQRVEQPKVQSTKRDDIGIALAARR